MAKSPNEPERPRVEPEILPPDRSGRGEPRWTPYGPSGFTQAHGTHRVFVGRIGPLGFAALILMVGLFAGILLLALIGAALIWLPLVAVLVVIAAISGIFRRR